MSGAALKAAATGQVAAPKKNLFDIVNSKSFQQGLAKVVGKFITPDKMASLCINAIKKTPKLLECDPVSVTGAMMASAALQLEPNTVQQQAFLIPYKKRVKVGERWMEAYDCQFQVGARGFVTLAYRSPDIRFLTAEAIHDGDKWEQEVGSQSFLRYSKTLKDRGALLGSFSYVRFASGDEGACVLPLDEILKIRSKSETFRALTRNIETAENEKELAKAKQQYAETPWVMWEDDMASKSAIKKHAKQLPLASGDAMALAASIDDHAEAGTIDMRSFADPDVAVAVLQDEAQVPAIENTPTEGFQGGGEAFGATARRHESVDATEAQPGKKSEKKAATPAKASAPVKEQRQEVAAQQPPSYAQLADSIIAAKDADIAAVVLDEGRHLPEDQQRDLQDVYRKHWES